VFSSLLRFAPHGAVLGGLLVLELHLLTYCFFHELSSNFNGFGTGAIIQIRILTLIGGMVAGGPAPVVV
jgi:hypothetical protein